MAGRLIIAVVLIAAAPEALADTATELADQAGKKVEAKQFAEAAELYRKAAELEPNEPKHLCNTGMAYYAADKYTLANHYIERCAELDRTRRTTNGDVITYLRGLAKPENKLALFTLVAEVDGKKYVGATITCKHLEDHGALHGGGNYLLPYGDHEFVIEAEGYQREVYRDHIDNTTHTIERIHLKPIAEPDVPKVEPKTESPPEPDRRVEPEVPVPAVTTSAQSSRWSRKGPWIAFGGAALAGVVGVVALNQALETRDDRFDCEDGKSCQNFLDEDEIAEARRDVRRWEYLEFSMYAVAAGAVGLGVYLLARDNPEEQSLTVSAAPQTGGGMVWLTVVR